MRGRTVGSGWGPGSFRRLDSSTTGVEGKVSTLSGEGPVTTTTGTDLAGPVHRSTGNRGPEDPLFPVNGRDVERHQASRLRGLFESRTPLWEGTTNVVEEDQWNCFLLVCCGR